ncbi:MAG: hypothetical protein WAQ99_01550 [Pyrinomonadaceae bacterium]
MADLTHDEFSKHVGSKFQIPFTDGDLELTLTEVKAYMPEPNEQSGMERFSVFFDGPPNLLLPTQTYLLRHEPMGQFELFLGAISRDAKGIRYEAVFNYYKENE